MKTRFSTLYMLLISLVCFARVFGANPPDSLLQANATRIFVGQGVVVHNFNQLVFVQTQSNAKKPKRDLYPSAVFLLGATSGAHGSAKHHCRSTKNKGSYLGDASLYTACLPQKDSKKIFWATMSSGVKHPKPTCTEPKTTQTTPLAIEALRCHILLKYLDLPPPV